jgi:hypothetical protein
METTFSLSWNPAIVEAKVLGLKLTENNKQVMGPALAKK